MDILLYPRHSGGLNHVATILSELIEAIDLEKFNRTGEGFQRKDLDSAQGYILEHIESIEPKKQSRIIELL